MMLRSAFDFDLDQAQLRNAQPNLRLNRRFVTLHNALRTRGNVAYRRTAKVSAIRFCSE
jgi:hypothetical protein